MYHIFLLTGTDIRKTCSCSLNSIKLNLCKIDADISLIYMTNMAYDVSLWFSLGRTNLYLIKKDPYLTMEDLYLEEHHG